MRSKLREISLLLLDCNMIASNPTRQSDFEDALGQLVETMKNITSKEAIQFELNSFLQNSEHYPYSERAYIVIMFGLRMLELDKE